MQILEKFSHAVNLIIYSVVLNLVLLVYFPEMLERIKNSLTPYEVESFEHREFWGWLIGKPDEEMDDQDGDKSIEQLKPKEKEIRLNA